MFQTGTAPSSVDHPAIHGAMPGQAPAVAAHTAHLAVLQPVSSLGSSRHDLVPQLHARTAPIVVQAESSLDMMSQDESGSSSVAFRLANGALDNIDLSVDENDEPYEAMSADIIRKLCTRRKIVLPTRTKKAERIAALRKYDSIAANYLEAIGRPLSESDRTTEPRRSRACIFRLLNLLFSDEFCDRFAQSGDSLTREQLDSGVNARDAFWNDIAAAFATDHSACSALLAADEMFEGVQLSMIVPHKGQKLQGMWKEANAKFLIANARFRQSGTHTTDFKSFVSGRADTFYLHFCLQIKPNLTEFVRGGLLEEDEYDSLQLQLHPNRRRPVGENGDTTPSKSKRSAPTDNTPPNSKRAKTKHSPGTTDTFKSLARSVERFVMQHQELQERGISQKATIASVDRAALFRLLDDFRARIDSIKDSIASANEEDADRLHEELTLCLDERREIMEKLGRTPK